MLTKMAETIQQYIVSFGSFFRIQDALDILILAVVFYMIIDFIHETRAMQLVKGIGFLVVIMLISDVIELNAINYVLRHTLQVGVMAIVVIFQPELRRALEKMGTATFKTKMFTQDLDTNQIKKVCDEISSACAQMSSTRTGCLMVLERTSKLSDIAHTGVKIDSLVSEGLLINIFVPNTPLHDGAVIIRGGRVHSAACVLPLTQNPNLDSELGTRHRAGIGMSENSDAVVVIVSEETGKISLAVEGALTRNLTKESLNKALRKLMLPQDEDASGKSRAARFIERRKSNTQSK